MSESRIAETTTAGNGRTFGYAWTLCLVSVLVVPGIDGVVLSSCKGDPAREEQESLARLRAETSARRAKLMGTDPQSVAAAVRASAEALADERSGATLLRQLRAAEKQSVCNRVKDDANRVGEDGDWHYRECWTHYELYKPK